MIGAGIDVLNPIQWRCTGMEREGLKRTSATDSSSTAAWTTSTRCPSAPSTRCGRRCADNLRILGAGGGYILAPCHNIQAVSPAENVVAMYETAYALGRS